MMKITTVGIDLGKNVFSVHGIDEHGKAVLKRTVSRGKAMEVMAGIGPCLIGVEACSGAHHCEDPDGIVTEFMQFLRDGLPAAGPR